MNSDHTHFIIIREQPIGISSLIESENRSVPNDTGDRKLEKLTDSAESRTNKFRDRFEDFLHQETLQGPPPATTGSTSKYSFSV